MTPEITTTSWTVVATQNLHELPGDWVWLVEGHHVLRDMVRAGTMMQAQRKAGEGRWDLVMRLPHIQPSPRGWGL